MPEKPSQFQALGEKLERFLRPATFPLAVRLLSWDEDVDSSFKRPSRDLGVQNFVCQNFKMARTYGWTMALTEKDINCHIARGIFGWDAPTREVRDMGHKFNIGLYAKDMETSAKLECHLFGLANACKGLAISPLSRTKVEPHVVLVYGLPAQIVRMIQGWLYMEGGAMEFTSTGRIGSCHEGVVKTHLTQKPQFVVLGNGDRVWGGAQDSEVMFAVPAPGLEILLEGLEATHKAGLRYPTPQYMNYTPGFQQEFEQRAMDRAGGTIIKK